MLLIPPNYGLCLRIYHPHLNPEEITNRLGLIPETAWMAGGRRQTPTGRLLDGVNNLSYWCHTFETADEIGPNEFLSHIFKILLPNRDFFENAVSTDGRAELYFTIRRCENAGDILRFAILKNFVELNIDLSIELFP